MQKIAFVLNPKAGRGGVSEALRDGLAQIVADSGGTAVFWVTTAEPDSARQLAAEAVASCDTVIACGGDGTVHGVLQGLAGTQTCMGVLPLGTANALARHLRLPLDPLLAMKRLLSYSPRAIPLGCAETARGRRWFTVMAGAGPDGQLIHEMKPGAKARSRRMAYYSRSARLFLSRRFPTFRVEYQMYGSACWESRLVVGMMASRIPDLGGLFRGLTSGSRLDHPHLRVQLLSAPAHLSFSAWMTLGKMGWSRANPWLRSVEVQEIRCFPGESPRSVYGQVDGEAVGEIPLSLRPVSSALRLLMP